tara:strand:+ start:115 stop:654 length:540 start_codon:yes stop_codon:yes gene_type:complete
MSLWAAQVWLGMAIAVIGFGMHRTGPAFRRHPFGAPVALLGLAVMLFRVEEPPQPESEVVVAAIDAAMWLLPALIGSAFVLMGAPLYWRTRLLPLLAGWALIVVAWCQYYSTMSVVLSDTLRWVTALLGVVLAFTVFALCVRTAERMTPQEPETEGLSEKERKYVESVLRRHLEVADEP